MSWSVEAGRLSFFRVARDSIDGQTIHRKVASSANRQRHFLPSLFPASCSADASYRTPRVVATSGRRLPLRAVPVSVAVVAAAMAVWSVHYMPLLLHVITVR